MTQYFDQIKKALAQNTPLDLPAYFNAENLWQYTDNYNNKNILVVGTSLEENEPFIKNCPYNVAPLFKNIEAYNDLKAHKDWADLIIVTATPSPDTDFNRELYKRLYRTLKRHGQLVSLVTLADDKDSTQVSSGHPIQEGDYYALLEYQKYHGIALLSRAEWPKHISNRIEHREFIITAFKGKEGICYEEGHAIIYTGPFKQVTDDGGHTLFRGKRMAVCEKTFKLLTTGPYKNCIIGLEPYNPTVDSEPVIFDCTVDAERSAKKTKGLL